MPVPHAFQVGWPAACDNRPTTGSTSTISGCRTPMPADPADSVSILVDGRQPLAIEDVVAVARGETVTRLSDADDFLARIGRGADFVDRLIAEDGVVYGVSTGYGDSCTVAIPP